MQSRVKEAIILAVAILCLGAFFYRAQIDVKERDRVVFVRGLAEREVPADFVIWPIVYKEVGNDLAELSATLQSKSQILEKFLLENGVKKKTLLTRPRPLLMPMANCTAAANIIIAMWQPW